MVAMMSSSPAVPRYHAAVPASNSGTLEPSAIHPRIPLGSTVSERGHLDDQPADQQGGDDDDPERSVDERATTGVDVSSRSCVRA